MFEWFNRLHAFLCFCRKSEKKTNKQTNNRIKRKRKRRKLASSVIVFISKFQIIGKYYGMTVKIENRTLKLIRNHLKYESQHENEEMEMQCVSDVCILCASCDNDILLFVCERGYYSYTHVIYVFMHCITFMWIVQVECSQFTRSIIMHPIESTAQAVRFH